MKRATLFVCLLGLLNISTPLAGAEEGFEPLFNGTDLTGWDADERFWSVRDGTITAQSTPENPCNANTFAIWKGGEVADFELRLQYRIVGGNSGVQYRSKRFDGFNVGGYQADIEAGTTYSGILYEERGRGILAQRGERVVVQPNGERQVQRFAAGDELQKAIHQETWNDYTIIAQGNRLQHLINGKLMSEVVDNQADKAARSGVLALQIHAGPPMTVQFRNIRIKHLAADAAAVDDDAASNAVVDARTNDPQWIWADANPQDNDKVFFRRAFTMDDDVLAAMLTGTCDNTMDVFLNGKHVATGTDWRQPIGINVTKALRRGRNVLAVVGRNAGGPAGLTLKLEMTRADRSRVAVITDEAWLTSRAEVSGWSEPSFVPEGWTRAHAFGKVGTAPWGELPRGRGGAPSVATPAEDLKLLDGFKAELLYTVPLATQGSWVSLAVDPKNRLYTSDQHGPLYRVTVHEDDVTVEKVNVDIGNAQGMLWAYDSLYVMVAEGKGTGMYRLRDTDGDDQLDTKELLLSVRSGGEHGPHAIVQGPDGLIYIMAGNHVPPPQKMAEDSPLRRWGEDQLLPRLPDGNGHATNVMAPGGWIAVTDENGSSFRLLAGGLRNAYDFSFNRDGEIFTFDSDMEWDTGTPWYRPTRVNHMVSGADFGWRFGTGKWPAYYPDSVGAVVDIGLSSPTGTTFGYGAKFPAKYQDALFIQDWSYGKIYAVHLQPNGATYTGAFEVFLEGKPLPVTDIVIGRDGAMYFTIGGRKTQSALYRVTYVGDESTASIDSDKPTGDTAAQEARQLRRKLEAYHGKPDSNAVDFAWPHLNSPDRAIRYAARVVIEHQDVNAWADRALAESHVNASIQALLALARCGEAAHLPKLLASLDRLPLARLTEEQMLDALRVYGLAFIRLGRPDAGTASALVSKFDELFPSRSDWINRELARLLVYLESPSIASKAMKLLEEARTQEDYIYYIFVLHSLRNGWTTELREQYFRWINLASTKFKGGSSFANFMRNIKNEAVKRLSDEEKAALEQVLNDPVQVVQIEMGPPRQFVHNWQMDDIEPLLSMTTQGRSFESGKAAFAAASCIQCHRFAGDGGSTGQDLTGVGGRFSPRDLLESIIHPSRVISDQYADTAIHTVDGELIVGRIEAEDDTRVVVRAHPLIEETTEVRKEDIVKRELSKVSKMPQGLLNVLTKEEVLDLIAYLRSGGNPDDPAFR